MIRVVVVMTVLALAVTSTARPEDVARACAASPYRVGDNLTRYGPPGDQVYNALVVRQIYVVFGNPHPSQCLAIHCQPTAPYIQRIEGWLYRTSYGRSPKPVAWNWYTRGTEMDMPLQYVPDPLAPIVTRTAHHCP